MATTAPRLSFKLSLRLPPTVNAHVAAEVVKRELERNPPYGARVEFQVSDSATGWHAPPLAPWLESAALHASRHVFGREAIYAGSGGTIPFLSLLGGRFPDTQFFVTGVLGPQSNAQGPNEFLHIEYATKLTECVALVLAEQAIALSTEHRLRSKT